MVPSGRTDEGDEVTRAFSLAVVCVLSLAFVSVARASVTVGQLFTPTMVNCAGITEVIQTGVASGNSYAVPSAGVITSWSFQENSTTVAGLKLKVARSPDGANFTFVGESTAGPQTPNTVNTYPARIPVQAGDEIGILENGGGGCDTFTGAAGDTYASLAADTPPGETAPLMPGDSLKIPVAATVEPDADHDGFGDETQDQCPTDASTQGPCPPPPDKTAPALSASAHSAKLSKRGTISLFVTSNENSTGTATGTISVPKLAKTVRFAMRSVTLAAGKRTKLTLKLSKKNAALVRKALAKRKKLTAKITLSVKDAAGNPTTKKLSLKLKR
jgi:hypothetical protein